MPWSRTNPKSEVSAVLKKETQKNASSDISVLNYVPKQIVFGTPGAAIQYLNEKEKGSDFVMSDVLRRTTGVDEIEKQSEEQKIENKVLEKLGTIQEEAYDKAYQLGLEEGVEKAMKEKGRNIEHQLADLEQTINQMKKLKEEMMKQNESHLIQLAYQIASRIAYDHIEEKPETVLSVMKNAIEMAQSDEEITVLVAADQVDFLEKMKAQTGRDFEFLKKVKLQVSDQVTTGGCIIETNYGVVDARLEERVSKLWSEMKQALPRVKSPIS